MVEVMRLAAIFGISPAQLNARCVNCAGHPPAGFACLTCGATPGTDNHAATGRVAGLADHVAVLR
jgi:hypothetical protein